MVHNIYSLAVLMYVFRAETEEDFDSPTVGDGSVGIYIMIVVEHRPSLKCVSAIFFSHLYSITIIVVDFLKLCYEKDFSGMKMLVG